MALLSSRIIFVVHGGLIAACVACGPGGGGSASDSASGTSGGPVTGEATDTPLTDGGSGGGSSGGPSTTSTTSGSTGESGSTGPFGVSTGEGSTGSTGEGSSGGGSSGGEFTCDPPPPNLIQEYACFPVPMGLPSCEACDAACTKEQVDTALTGDPFCSYTEVFVMCGPDPMPEVPGQCCYFAARSDQMVCE